MFNIHDDMYRKAPASETAYQTMHTRKRAEHHVKIAAHICDAIITLNKSVKLLIFPFNAGSYMWPSVIENSLSSLERQTETIKQRYDRAWILFLWQTFKLFFFYVTLDFLLRNVMASGLRVGLPPGAQAALLFVPAPPGPCHGCAAGSKANLANPGLWGYDDGPYRLSQPIRHHLSRHTAEMKLWNRAQLQRVFYRVSLGYLHFSTWARLYQKSLPIYGNTNRGSYVSS